MAETTLIRVSKATKELIDGKKGDQTVDSYLGSLVGSNALSILPPTEGRTGWDGLEAGEVLEWMKKIESKLEKPKPVVLKGSGGKKCKETILEDFDRWAEGYVKGFMGKAQEYTLDHVKKFRGWLEGESLDIDPMHGPGEG